MNFFLDKPIVLRESPQDMLLPFVEKVGELNAKEKYPLGIRDYKFS